MPNFRHGLVDVPEYRVWGDMRSRCANPRTNHWKNYGGRGITVCERWCRFENFYADMGPRPSAAHTIERKDNDKGYEPDNCKWATRTTQVRNRRNTVRLTAHGKTLPLIEWARLLGIRYKTLYARYKHGWSITRMIPSG